MQQLQEGPIKDKERLERRLNLQQRGNLEDFERQKILKEQLEKDQPLTGVIVKGLEK